MIVFTRADGSVITVTPTPVYQGSALNGTVYFVAPYPRTNAVSLAFKLPDGTYTENYGMTSVSDLPGVTDSLGAEYSVWLWPTSNADITKQAGVVIAQFSVYLPNGQLLTTSRTSFNVEAGVLPIPPPEPPQDAWDQILQLINYNAARISDLEDKITAKTLADFTVNDETGAGVKYYSDGSTATVQFPTGGSSPDIRTDWLRVLTFTTDSWVLESDGSYALAFGPAQTGYTDNQYMALCERNGMETYEAGDETTESAKTGVYSMADCIFKGSDGSIYMTANETYAGRLLLLGGTVFSGQLVTSATYNTGTHMLRLNYINGSYANIQFDTALSQFTNDVNYQTQAQVSAAIGVETTARQNADSALSTRIDSNDTDISALQTGLASANSAISGLQEEVASKEHFRGYYATTAQVQAIPNPDSGDFAYNAQTGTKWAYDTSWTDTQEAVPDQTTPKSTIVPLMNGTAAVGSENAYAAGNHVHPTDTSRASVAALNTETTNRQNADNALQSSIDTVTARDAVTGVSYNSGTAVLTATHRNGTSDTIQLPVPGAATRYTGTIASTAWTGSAAPYSYAITAATHGKGTTPIVQCTNNGGEIVSLGVRIATNGDVTLYTNEKLIAYVTIL